MKIKALSPAAVLGRSRPAALGQSPRSFFRWMAYVAVFFCILAGTTPAPTFVEDQTIEEALDHLRERFEIAATEEGWELRPLEASADYEIIDVGRFRVAVDDVSVSETELQRFVGRDDAERLFFLSNGGYRTVDTVPPG